MATIGRRRMLLGMTAVSAALGGAPLASRRTAWAQTATPVPADAEAAVDAGLAYFRRRAADQIPLAEALREAIAGGEIEAAKRAYVAARPPYEEIEVLAASFPETDEAIDARPYAIAGGETSPDYVSIHRIEAAIFRDGDLASALPFAEGLIESARTLINDLDRREAFSAGGSFDGMLALSEEVASKKISSEEETWSDQSLLIFFHNWRGIESQYTPFARLVGDANPDAAAAVADAFAAAFASIAEWPAENGIFPPYSTVPPAARGAIVRASYALRDALAEARAALTIA